MFAEQTEWHMPWLEKVLPNIVAIAERHPAETIFTRFIPARQPGRGVGMWRHYYERWASMTLDRLGHVTFSQSETRFRFRGKTGKVWRLAVSDRRIARIVRSCQDLPGQHLFQYEDPQGIHAVTSEDVNAYLRENTGEDISAKDFRTWAGTVLTAIALSEYEAVDSEAAAKRNVRRAIEIVSAKLSNTPTICRKCYVHPEILQCYFEGQLTLKSKIDKELRRHPGELSAAETATLALLHRRLRERV